MNENLLPNIRLYAVRHQLELGEALGSGKDGIVVVGKSKDGRADVAVKGLRFDELYGREKQAYERLKQLRVTKVLEFNVPQVLGSADDLRVIEMTIVERPFVLDFAAAYLDTRPQFSPEIWADWENNKREQFESRWSKVQEILDAFEEFGIYLLDVSPANIAFVD